MTEACYRVGKYVGADAEMNFAAALAGGDLGQVDIAASDLIRRAELMRQYRGFPLGRLRSCDQPLLIFVQQRVQQ